MAYDDLKSLIDHLNASSLSFIDYQTADEHIILSKEAMGNIPQPSDQGQDKSEPLLDNELEKQDQSDLGLSSEQASQTIDSPMVGVAYLQAKPDEKPFVQVGDQVKKGQVVMIVEAMKLMNEIQADKSGQVAEILVDNEQVVEYGQALIRIQ